MQQVLRRSSRRRLSTIAAPSSEHATLPSPATEHPIAAVPGPSQPAQQSSRKRKAVALDLPEPDQLGPSPGKATKPARARASRSRASASTSQPPQPSAKALGKRRALSLTPPPPSPPANPAKRKRKDYNLRSAPQRGVVFHDMTPASNPNPSELKGKGKKNMPPAAGAAATSRVTGKPHPGGSRMEDTVKDSGDVVMDEEKQEKDEAIVPPPIDSTKQRDQDGDPEDAPTHEDAPDRDSEGDDDDDDDDDNNDNDDDDDEDDDEEGDEDEEDDEASIISDEDSSLLMGGGAPTTTGLSSHSPSHHHHTDAYPHSSSSASPGASAEDSLLAALEGGAPGFRALHGLMSGLSGRLKGLLARLKARGDAQAILSALQELAELLGVATEDTLAGYFQVDPFVKEIVSLLRGDASPPPGSGGSGGMTAEEMLAFGMDPGDIGGGTEEDGVQIMLLACRCLANLMEALPGSAHAVVYAGAVPVLCGKLVEIQYIDLAEQTLSTLEKISEEVPSSIVREGGLGALLTYLDFFSFHVQRTAVTAAANCCRSLSPDSFNMVRDAIPILTNVLSSPDQRVVEQACLAVVRVVESYRHYPDKLEAVLTPELLSGLRSLLNPDSSTVGVGTYTQCLKMLAIAAKASPLVAIKLLELNVGSTLYHLLTGVAAPEWESDDGVQRLREEEADRSMMVMQNLVQRPKDQIDQTLSLVCELMPSLPRDGIFDSRAFSGKPPKHHHHPVVKREELTPDLGVGPSVAAVAAGVDDPEVKMEVVDEEPSPADRRLAMSRGSSVVVRRFYALMLPTLVDVYAASVNSQVRNKAVTGLLKIVEFSEEENLAWILKTVAMASFLGAILSSRDQSSLVTHALQLVELLLVKMPDAYQYFFRREGVMHEIERLASQPLVSVAKSKKGSPTRSSSSTGSGISRLLQQQGTLSVADAQSQDMITLRARHLQEQYAAADSEPAVRARTALDKIKSLVKELEEDSEVVVEIAKLFADETNPMSSFELLESGLVEGLLRFTSEVRQQGLTVSQRQEKLAKAFMPQLLNAPATPAFGLLVKRLQESLSRMEEFEVTLAAQNSSDLDSRRNGSSMLARQLKLRLIAEDGSDVPRTCSNLVVSIHAIATFQAFNDYLRPRIIAAASLADRTAGSRSAPQSGAGTLSSFLAAFAAANGSASPPDSSAVASGSGSRLSASLDEPSGSTSAPTRRRSTRLSGKGAEADAAEDAPSTSKANLDDPPDHPEDQPMDDDEDENNDMCPEDDDHDDDELFAADFDPAPPSRDERTVHLEVADDKLVAKTPDGTRVGTPTLGKSASTSRLSGGSAAPRARASYAAAVKSEPTDFHLEFSMAGQAVSLDTTVYGGVHKYLATTPESRRNIWQQVYTITFKKSPGAARTESERLSPEPVSRDDAMPTVMPASIPADSQQAKILQLLWVLHTINSEYGDSTETTSGAMAGLSEAAFVNNKLTAKLNRQLEEPMIVASACLPDWATDLPQTFPFLFPFETRYIFLQSTAFGYARLMQKWVGQTRSDLSRRDENLGFLGRLQRQKVRISRDRMLESAFKVFELYGASRASLEVEFFFEVGSGLGPTLEFYALVSKEFARKDLGLWRDGDPSGPSAFVFNATGLFPIPIDDVSTEAGKKKLKVFRVLGQFVAKALMDSRIIDVHFSRSFMKMVVGYELPLKISSVKHVDKSLGQSLAHLHEFVDAKRAIEADESLPEKERTARINAIQINDSSVADMALDFVLPGYDIDLKPDGKSIPVDIWNIEEYISLVIDWTLRKGVLLQVKEFKSGFSSVFPVGDLHSFTPTELVMMTGSVDEDWSVEGLTTATKADHGFTMDSRPVRDLISIMSELTPAERREFLSFITGSPRLPIGGFSALTPSLTVVRKDGGDGSLPSVMTCVNYIKLPDYSSRAIVKERVMTAVREGAGGFHLS